MTNYYLFKDIPNNTYFVVEDLNYDQAKVVALLRCGQHYTHLGCVDITFFRSKPDIKPDSDKINPSHYTQHPSGVECIEVTRHHNFCVGNAIKYLWRAGLKTSESVVDDLSKARWYITEEINRLTSKK